MSRRILLLHTGGTLGMSPRHPDQALAPDEFGHTVLEHVPELAQLAEIETKVLFNLDSTDLGPAHWKQLAETVVAARDRCDGVVITHGTDAMAYTASALSYLFKNLDLPVILTGSQRPLSDVHTDGRANLVGAVDLAARRIPEVAIYFNGTLLRGNRAIKQSTFAFGAFYSPNFGPLAEIGTGVRLRHQWPTRTGGQLRVEGDFDSRVAVIWLHPGGDGRALKALVDADLFGVLVVAPGMGNVPVETTGVAEAVKALCEAGKVVAMASQASSGGVDLERYAGGQLANDSGAVGIGDMTVEAAVVKMMYLAGSGRTPRQVGEQLTVDLAGEVSR